MPDIFDEVATSGKVSKLDIFDSVAADDTARAGMDAGRLATVQRTKALRQRPVPPLQPAVMPNLLSTSPEPTPGVKPLDLKRIAAERINSDPIARQSAQIARNPNSLAVQAFQAAAAGDVATLRNLAPTVIKEHQERANTHTILGSRALGRIGQAFGGFSDSINAPFAGPTVLVPHDDEDRANKAYADFLHSLPPDQQQALYAAINEVAGGGDVAAGKQPATAMRLFEEKEKGGVGAKLAYGVGGLINHLSTDPASLALFLGGPATGTVRALRGAGAALATGEQTAVAARTAAALNLLKQAGNVGMNAAVAAPAIADFPEAVRSGQGWEALPGALLGAYAGFHGLRGVRELPQGVRTLRGANKTVQGIRAEAAMGGPEGAAANAKRVWKDLVTEIHPDVVPEPLRGVANDLTAEANAVIRGKGKATEKIEKLGEIRGRWEEANRNGRVSEEVRPGGVQGSQPADGTAPDQGAEAAPAPPAGRPGTIVRPETGRGPRIVPEEAPQPPRPATSAPVVTTPPTPPTGPLAETAPPAPTEAPVPPTNTVRGVRGTSELVTPESQVGERKPTDAVQIGSAEAQVPGAPQGRQDQPGNGGGVRPSQPGNVAANPSGEAGPVEAPAPAQVGNGRTVYRGSGRKDKASAYGDYASTGVLGDDAVYYAHSSEVAKNYGPKVESVHISPRNPLVIRTDDDWKSATGLSSVNFLSIAMQQAAQEGLNGEMWDARVRELGKQFGLDAKRKIGSAGHDAVVVEMVSDDRAKRLRELFGHDQTILLNRQEASTSSALGEVTKEGGQTVVAPSKATVKKAKAERLNPATGMTATQEAFLTAGLSHAVANESFPATIEIPDDGKFTVRSANQANNLHASITGQPLIGQKADVGKAKNLTPPRRFKPMAEKDLKPVPFERGGSELVTPESQMEGEDEGITELGAPMRAATVAPRMRVAALKGGQPKKLRVITDEFAKSLGKSIRFGLKRRGALGLYTPANANTQVRFRGDLDTIGHEVAHYLDDSFGVVKDWAKPRVRSPYDAELSEYWPYGSVTSKSTLAYKRAEGVAEFIRAYIMNPEGVRARSSKHPKSFLTYLETKLPKEAWASIDAYSKSVRELAGLSGVERTLANVRTEVEQKPGPDVAGLLGREKADTTFETTARDKVVAAIVDELWPVEKAANAAERIRQLNLAPSEDPRYLMRLWHGYNEKAEDILAHGMIDAEGNRVTNGGAEWLLEPFDKSSFETLKRDKETAVAYAISERAIEKGMQIWDAAQEKVAALDPKDPKYIERKNRIERAARYQMDRLVTGVNAGLEGASDMTTAAEVIAEVRSNPALRTRIEEGVRRLREWADANLRYALEKGYISEDDYSRIKAENAHYVSFKRISEETESPLLMRKSAANRLGSSRKTLHRFKGGTRTIEDPYVSLMTDTFKLMREVDRNEVMQRFTDLLTGDRKMYQGDVQHLADIGSRVGSGERNTITVRRGGKAEYWRFEDGVYQALKGWGEIAGSNVLTAMAGVLRFGVTAAPAFRIRNLIRDTQERSITTDVGSKPTDVLRKPSAAEREEAILAGAGMAGHYSTDERAYMRKLEQEMMRLSKDPRTILLVPRLLTDWWNKVGEAGEMRNRQAEYRRAKEFAKKNEPGWTERDRRIFAAWQARALLDFQRGGWFTKKVNQYIPFTNPQVQGQARNIRAWRKRPLRTFAKWFLLVLAPALAIREWNRRAGALKEEREQPDYLKDMFTSVKVGDNLWLRVPRPHDMGVLAGGVERYLDYLEGDKDAFQGYMGSVKNAILPADDASLLLFRAEVENAANWDFFRDRPVIPDYEDELDVRLRANASQGSRLGALIGGPLGVDPRNVDHIIEGHFGHLGRIAENLSDIGREDKPTRRSSVMNDFTGLFAASPGSQAKSVQEALSTAKAAGLSNDRQVVRLRGKLKRLYAAKTDADRDDAAADAREYAASILPRLKERAENAYERGSKVKR